MIYNIFDIYGIGDSDFYFLSVNPSIKHKIGIYKNCVYMENKDNYNRKLHIITNNFLNLVYILLFGVLFNARINLNKFNSIK